MICNLCSVKVKTYESTNFIFICKMFACLQLVYICLEGVHLLDWFITCVDKRPTHNNDEAKYVYSLTRLHDEDM